VGGSAAPPALLPLPLLPFSCWSALGGSSAAMGAASVVALPAKAVLSSSASVAASSSRQRTLLSLAATKLSCSWAAEGADAWPAEAAQRRRNERSGEWR
jgi:hypothetical protein